MAITPAEIANKEFLVGLRGYDKDEVRAYLQTVAAAFDAAPSADDATGEADSGGETDLSNLGGQIEAILSTARDEAAKLRAQADSDTAKLRSDADEETAGLRADAEAETAKLRADADAYGESTRAEAEAYAETTRAEADAYAESTRAEAEQVANEARQKLTAAQDDALGLVADAQVRVEKMIERSRVEAVTQAEAAVAGLTGQITELTTARDTSRSQLSDLRSKIDKALAVADATDPS
jgi:DivIVA domain-containing protein